MKLFYFKNHVAMIISTVIAILLSCCMAVVAMIRAHLPMTTELVISNWGTAFLTIMLVSMAIPCKMLGDKFAVACRLKPDTLLFGLLSNLIPTFFYNTAATLVLVGANVGFAAPYYWNAVAADYAFMFVLSYILSLAAERLGLIVAVRSGAVPQHPPV